MEEEDGKKIIVKLSIGVDETLTDSWVFIIIITVNAFARN